MQDSKSGPDAAPKTGWDNIGTLEIRHKPGEGPVAFSFGPYASVWVGLCCVVAVLTALARGAPDNAGALGYATGSGLGVWLIAYAIGWLVWRLAGRNLSAGRVAVCIIAGLSAAGSAGRGIEQVERNKDQIALARDLRQDLHRLSRSAESDGPIAAVNPKATVGGELGEVQEFTKAHLNKVISLQNDYMAELKAIGWTTVLDPDRIQKDQGLAESHAVVARARETVEKYRQRWTATSAETLTLLDGMETNSSVKRGFVAGFRKSSATANLQTLEIWNLEANIVSTTEEIFELLAAREGAWTVESGQLVFADQETLDAFNGYVERMNELVARQDSIRRANAVAVEASLKEAERN